MDKEKIDILSEKIRLEIIATQDGIQREESLLRLLEEAKRYEGTDQVVPFSEIVARVKAAGETEKINTSWVELDKILKGFRPKQNIIISALPKSGKTSFMMDLTIKLEAYNPLWFAFEESVDELVSKYLERGQEPPHAFTPQTMVDNKMEWLESRIFESKAKWKTKVVIIDQLDWIVPFEGENHHLKIARTMRDLKTLAKKLDVVIFTICHLSKTPSENQPSYNDLRGSSAIGGECDMAIILWRESKRENGQFVVTDNVNVSVQLNRTGKTGNVKMIYDNGQFIEKFWGDAEEQAKEEFKNF